MTEKSNEKESKILSKSISDLNYPVKRSRGRPKGSKNKPKETKLVEVDPVVKKRGRPKGSKNLPKETKVTEDNAVVAVVKKRGRPKGSQNKKTLEHEEASPKIEASLVFVKPSTVDQEHPLIVAVKWIEKHMHISQMQYYRSRATRNETSIHATMAADILGFFNVQNAEILKSIKKNNFIV
jgi:hypothetical protein